MLICESCGAVFEYADSRTDRDTGYTEELCPECGSTVITKAVKCQVCEDWVSEDDAFGFSHTVCENCINEERGDLDLLYKATKDECEDFDLPVLFRTFFTDDEIMEILMRELKACHAQIPRDTKNFVRRWANEIADEIERLRRDVKKQQEKMFEMANGLPKHGEYIKVADHVYRCSLCNDHRRYPSNYCPKCGAKMEVQK